MWFKRLSYLIQTRESTSIKELVKCHNKRLFHSCVGNQRSLNASINEDETLEKERYLEYSKSRSGDKRVYVWGLSEHGALGYLLEGKSKKRTLPYIKRPLRLHFAYNHPISHAACGYGFTVFGVTTSQKHKVFGCGINSDAQIGFHDPRKDNPLALILSPVPVNIPYKTPAKVKILNISAGRAHCSIVSTEGVHILGNNAYGQCGRPIVENEDYIKNKVPANYFSSLGNEKVIDVCCGQDHSMFLTESGKVYSCGWGADGQTGLGHFENEWSPSLVGGDISKEKIIKLSCSADCVLALNDKGEVFGWGNSEYGQLSNEDGFQQISSPRFLDRTKAVGKVIDIAAAGTNCAVLNEEGKMFTWGFGILGNGPKVTHNKEPTLIPPPLFGCSDVYPDTNIVKIECGLAQFAAITNYGNLYMWGRNNWGQIGLGHLKDQYFPLQVSMGALVKDVKCGVDHSVAICVPFI